LEDVHFLCQQQRDVNLLEGEDSITSPGPVQNCLNVNELRRLNEINVLRYSDQCGYEIFVEALQCLEIEADT